MELLLSLHKREQPSFQQWVLEAWSRVTDSGSHDETEVEVGRT